MTRINRPDSAARWLLVIGAMKSGTTSMYYDLECSSSTQTLPKETGWLLGDPAMRSVPRSDGSGGVMVDVSTTYSMLPDSRLAATNAARLLGEGTRVVYIVREPVARAISHHRHLAALDDVRGMGPDINVEVLRRPELYEYGRYAEQVAPWCEALGVDNVLIIEFERYVAGRASVLDEIADFAGIPHFSVEADTSTAFNSAETRVHATGFSKGVRQWPMYRKVVRPLVSPQLRAQVLRRMVRQRVPEIVPPTRQTLELIADRTYPWVSDLETMIAGPPVSWSRDAAISRIMRSVDTL